ncbi:MAG: amidohydrolase family protein [Alphaproteobacteria bacterium]|nr:amidohydrolase family protein [Alphaproteobacteria bacterium]
MKSQMFTAATAVGLLFISMTGPIAAKTPPPIIDMHVHAQSVASYGPPGQKFCTPHTEFKPFDPGVARSWPEEWLAQNLQPDCEQWVLASASDEALMAETLEVMERRNIIGVVGGAPDTVAKWKAAAPQRVVAARAFNLGRDRDVSPQQLADEFAQGAFEVLGEVTNQYAGYAPNAPEFEPYWALAEEKDFPVGIHIGTMPPGSAYLFGGAPRISLADPFLLEDVLVRHPRLRVYMMHAGYPHADKTIAMLRQYHQLYVEIGVLAVTMPRAEFHAFLERLVRAGMGKRIMFGSDQMIWPGIIEATIEAVETADIAKTQKRDIFYNNAARFLRFDEETIARHHDR